jgi:hypothetical protein
MRRGVKLSEHVHGDHQSRTGSLGLSCSFSMNCVSQTKPSGTKILALRNALNHTCDSWVLKLVLLVLAMVWLIEDGLIFSLLLGRLTARRICSYGLLRRAGS